MQITRYVQIPGCPLYCTCLQFNVLHGSCAEGLHFSALVDFRNAFDSVNRDLLWSKVERCFGVTVHS